MKRVVAEMHCSQMTIGYGQTEASPVVTQNNYGIAGSAPAIALSLAAFAGRECG